MINFEEELKKFKPSLEIDQAEEAIYKNRFPPSGQRTRPRDEAGRRRVSVWRREGCVLLCCRGARRFPSARQGPVLDAAHSRRHAPDRRA